MSKKVNYMELLKESVADDRGHDTTKTVDVNGPFLDPILGYDGGGELQTHKDASSILERYYFNQNADSGVTVSSEGESPEQDPAAEFHEPVGRADKDGKAASVETGKEEVKKDVKQEDVDLDGDLLEEDIIDDDVENAVLERLIAEMEEDSDLIEEEVEQDPVGKTKVHEPAGDPDKDSSGLIDGDKHEGGEGAVKPATFPAGGEEVSKGLKEEFENDLSFIDELLEEGYTEEEIIDGLLESDEADDTTGEEETPDDDKDDDKVIDVDDDDKDDNKEVAKESGSPIGNPGTADEFENLDEQFNIFKESIDDDDVEDFDDKDVIL